MIDEQKYLETIVDIRRDILECAKRITDLAARFDTLSERVMDHIEEA